MEAAAAAGVAIVPSDAENVVINESTAEPLSRPQLIATDFFSLLRPSECDLRVWLRAQDVEEAPPTPFARVLMDLGLELERRHLTRFPNHINLGHLPIAERATRTRELVAENDRVIYQGALRAETVLAGVEVEIVGVPDFLLPARSGYAIRDSKLARRIGNGRYPAIELQLATYGWLYEQTFGEPPIALQVHNGAGEIVDLPYEGAERALETLERIFRDRLAAEEPPEPVAFGKCSGCGFFERCWPRAVAGRSVGLLPWAGIGLIGELERRGVETIDQLLERYDAESLAEVERPWGTRTKKVIPLRRLPLELHEARTVDSASDGVGPNQGSAVGPDQSAAPSKR